MLAAEIQERLEQTIQEKGEITAGLEVQLGTWNERPPDSPSPESLSI